MRADRPTYFLTSKEVPMTKRLLVVAGVALALLVLAAPAMAFNGLRPDYTTSNACQPCHSGQFAGVPAVYSEWVETKHAEAGAGDQALRLPYGSVCQGCHTSNFDPAKVVPTPTATSGTGVVSWGAGNAIPTQPQTMGDAASSENFVGCSSCHYGLQMGGTHGSDPNNTAHRAPKGLLANAEICGQCHSRYSYTAQTFDVSPIPTPTAVATTLIQPQMALGGYPMLGAPNASGGWDPAPALSEYLIVQSPGWTPTPNPAATSGGFGRLQTYWQTAEGDTLPWQQSGHDGSAAQYPDWAIEGHANALTGLTSRSFWGFLPEATKQECLECHSTDFRIMAEAGEDPTSADAQYGITCVGCHTPHENNTAGGAWDDEWTPQLRTGSAQTLCVECHNGEIPEGTQASPGAEIHHPMKEMIDGYGAIDVAGAPSVHKGKCVECHMPPTSVSRGSVQLGGNHTFAVIEPEVALEASPIPVITAAATATASPGGVATVTVTSTITYDNMPYSACSTCHSNNNGVRATPRPYETITATPSPSATPVRVTVTVRQTANQSAWGNFSGGDRGVWLQDTMDQRREWTEAKIESIRAELDKAAKRLGYADTDAAHSVLVAVPAKQRTTAETAFLMGFTNVEFVASEGSFGMHNWAYSSAIVNKAMEQARIAATGVIVKLPYKPTLSLSKSSVKAGGKIKYSGKVTTARGVPAAGKVKIMKRVGGVWKVWKSTQLNASGKYSLTVKMTKKGTFYFRALMSADSLNKAGYSGSRKLVVK
jgi:hypothetical protein